MLLTHHHFDHVCEVGELRQRWPELEVLISPLERELLEASSAGAGGESQPPASATARAGTVEAGQTLQFGTLEVRPLHTPGHTGGMLSFLVGDRSGIGVSDGAGAPRARLRSPSSTAPGGFAGGEAVGEIGGWLTPAAEPAYYAKRISPATLGDRLTASGKLACTGPVHVAIAHPCATGAPRSAVV